MTGPRPGTAGTTRTCPHCRATILESASVCPACRHHLRFEPGAVKGAPHGFVALQVDGTLAHQTGHDDWEYTVVVSIRNAKGEEIGRHVAGVGALGAADQRTFAVSVEVVVPKGAPIPIGTAAELRAVHS